METEKLLNELKLGNWLKHNPSIWSYRNDDGVISNHQQFFEDCFQWEDYDWYALLECTLPDDAFEPILLTPEIIIRFGFEKGETEEDISMERYYKEKFILEKGFISSLSDNGYSYRITTDRFNSTHVCDVKYAHQLQNIYFITNNNKELTIKLD